MNHYFLDMSAKSLSLLIAFFVFSFSACKKDIPLEPEVSETSLCLVEIDGKFEQRFLDQMPIFINGGDQGFLNELSKNISYPHEARENGKSGKVTVQYDIEKEGSVNNIRIILDPGYGMGEASKNVLESIMIGIPFTPAILDGVPVKVRKEIQIIFRLE